MIGVLALVGSLFFAKAVAFAGDVDDGRSMQQSIEGGGGHHRIVGEDFAPVAERFVAGQADRLLPLVSFADHLKEQARLHGIEGNIADFVDDEELGLSQGVEVTVKPIGIDGLGQLVGNVRDPAHF